MNRRKFLKVSFWSTVCGVLVRPAGALKPAGGVKPQPVDHVETPEMSGMDIPLGVPWAIGSSTPKSDEPSGDRFRVYVPLVGRGPISADKAH